MLTRCAPATASRGSRTTRRRSPAKGDELGLRLVALGAGHAQLEVELQRRFYIAVAHVVAVADPGHGLALDAAAVLVEGLHVGEQLAGVQVVGQAVDHRHLRVRGEFRQGGVGEGADHHAVEHPRHDPGAVADRLAAAELGVARGEEDRLAAELDHPGFEGQAGTGRSLLEDHAQDPALQRLVEHASVAQVLQLAAAADQTDQLFGAVIHKREKVPYAHR